MGTATGARFAAVSVLVLLAGALVVLGGPPVVNNSLSVWFVDDDPARLAYERFQDLFGNDEVVILSAGTPGTPLLPATRAAVAATAAEMRGVEGIASVTGPDDAEAGPLAELLLAPDGSVALLMARLDVMADADAGRHAILVSLREAAAGLATTGVEIHWAGIGLVYDELNEISFQETPLLTGASFLVVGVVLYVVTGSMAPVFVALASVVVALMILMGVFALTGFQLNMVTAILPTLVLVMGTANAVHIFARLNRVRGESLEEALRDVFRPCLFTALTTAAGFASLAAARMAVIRDLGLFAALGVLVALLVSFTFVWALIATRWYRPGTGAETSAAPWSRALLAVVADVVVTHPWRILGGTAVVTGLALAAATGIVVDTYSIEFFREGHPVRTDSDAIEAAYGSYLPLEFAVHTGARGGALEAGLMESISNWQRGAEERGLAQWSLSVADFLGAEGVPAALDPVDAGLLDESGAAVRVTFGVPMASARGWAERIEAIREVARTTLPRDVEVTSGGYLPLYVRMMEYVVDTQVRSFAVALVLVFAFMGLFLKAPRMVLVALLPNLLPIVLAFGVMGALGIRLDIATVTVAAIALGIVVDDTVHLLFHFRRAMSETGDGARAVRLALMEVGPALLGTTAILASSFAVLGFASVLSIAAFGLLSAATLVFALLADLLVLPALLVVSTPAPAPAAAPHTGALA